MATYVIGDVQGCFVPLMQLLEQINFNPAHDYLWFTGDLVNRGPQSLEVLRFVHSLADRQVTVLGNHDLHLLSAYYSKQLKKHDTFQAILTAPDGALLMNWLRQQPLMHWDPTYKFALVHAGLAPSWSLEQALSLNAELQTVLQGDAFSQFLSAMYGNEPDHWDDNLTGATRWRVITNYFTRVRLCYADGRMDFAYKGALATKPDALYPWYALPARKTRQVNVLFGHWAALEGAAHGQNIHALDTGCVWGKCLTAMRLEDRQRFHVKCSSTVDASLIE